MASVLTKEYCVHFLPTDQIVSPLCSLLGSPWNFEVLVFFLLFIEAILTLSLALPDGSRKLGFLSLSDLELVVLICGTLLMGSGQGRVGCTSHLRNSVLIVMCRHFCCSEALVLPFNLWTY